MPPVSTGTKSQSLRDVSLTVASESSAPGGAPARAGAGTGSGPGRDGLTVWARRLRGARRAEPGPANGPGCCSVNVSLPPRTPSRTRRTRRLSLGLTRDTEPTDRARNQSQPGVGPAPTQSPVTGGLRRKFTSHSHGAPGRRRPGPGQEARPAEAEPPPPGGSLRLSHGPGQ